MLPKQHKLNLKQQSNRRLWQTGQQFKTEDWQASYDFKGEKAQLAVMTTKQVLPLAVDRNELKRKIYQTLAELTKVAGLRLIVRVKKSHLLKLDHQQLITSFQPLINEILDHVSRSKSH